MMKREGGGYVVCGVRGRAEGEREGTGQGEGRAHGRSVPPAPGSPLASLGGWQGSPRCGCCVPPAEASVLSSSGGTEGPALDMLGMLTRGGELASSIIVPLWRGQNMHSKEGWSARIVAPA